MADPSFFNNKGGAADRGAAFAFINNVLNVPEELCKQDVKCPHPRRT